SAYVGIYLRQRCLYGGNTPNLKGQILPAENIQIVIVFHVGASSISLAPTYFISQSALMPLLLLSKSNPLRWASIWFFLSLDI
ncbi:MAG: hypothetical protein MR648_11225, partial [Clostridiales bacterium]|nr:hypothetical protein [Clostridiales bacterium]